MKGAPDKPAAESLAPETVVLVHGLWMSGFELGVMARRMRRCGFRVSCFSYPSFGGTLEENTRALVECIRQQPTPVVHLVGVSLGGLMILKARKEHADLPPGRVVLLGSPVNGSKTARWFARHRLIRWMLGKSFPGGRLADDGVWQGTRNMGVIAGTRPWGIGRLGARLAWPHDGTVSVEETRLAGAAELTTVPATHIGLVLSREVVRKTCAFLMRGRFGE